MLADGATHAGQAQELLVPWAEAEKTSSSPRCYRFTDCSMHHTRTFVFKPDRRRPPAVPLRTCRSPAGAGSYPARVSRWRAARRRFQQRFQRSAAGVGQRRSHSTCAASARRQAGYAVRAAAWHRSRSNARCRRSASVNCAGKPPLRFRRATVIGFQCVQQATPVHGGAWYRQGPPSPFRRLYHARARRRVTLGVPPCAHRSAARHVPWAPRYYAGRLKAEMTSCRDAR